MAEFYDYFDLFIEDEDLIQCEADLIDEILEICLEIDNFRKD